MKAWTSDSNSAKEFQRVIRARVCARIDQHDNERIAQTCTKLRKARRPTFEAPLKSDKYPRGLSGDTLLVHATLYKKQEGVCAICGNPESSKRRDGTHANLALDHCHASNRIRGLLCRRCNAGLGFFLDSIQNLEKAIEYLRVHRRRDLSMVY